MPSSRYCVFGCVTKGLTVHNFPNPAKFPEQFRTWVECGGDHLKTLSAEEIYPRMKVCDRHFLNGHQNRNNRLSVIAVPTLHLVNGRTGHVDHNYCAEIDKETPEESSTDHSHDASNPTDVLQNLHTIPEDDDIPGHLDKGFIGDGSCSQQENLSADSTIDNVAKIVQAIKIESQSNIVNSEGKEYLPLTFTWSRTNSVINGQPADAVQKTVMVKISRNNNGQATQEKPKPVTTYQTRCDHYIRKLSPECLRLRRECQNLNIRLNKLRKARKAAKLTKEQSFEKLFRKVEPAAKQFMWMQVQLSSKKGKGRRFSLEDKMFALGMLKEAPKSYELLKTMFILPCKKTLRKLASQLQIDLSANVQKKPVKEAVTNDEDNELRDAPSPERSTDSTTSRNNKYSEYGQHIAEKLSKMSHHKASYCQKIINDAILMAETNTLNVEVVNNFTAQASSHYVSDPWGSDIRYPNS